MSGGGGDSDSRGPGWALGRRVQGGDAGVRAHARSEAAIGRLPGPSTPAPALCVNAPPPRPAFRRRSVFGEDALVNVSVEKLPDGKLGGYIRIRRVFCGGGGGGGGVQAEGANVAMCALCTAALRSLPGWNWVVGWWPQLLLAR